MRVGWASHPSRMEVAVPSACQHGALSAAQSADRFAGSWVPEASFALNIQRNDPDVRLKGDLGAWSQGCFDVSPVHLSNTSQVWCTRCTHEVHTHLRFGGCGCTLRAGGCALAPLLIEVGATEFVLRDSVEGVGVLCWWVECGAIDDPLGTIDDPLGSLVWWVEGGALHGRVVR